MLHGLKVIPLKKKYKATPGFELAIIRSEGECANHHTTDDSLDKIINI